MGEGVDEQNRTQRTNGFHKRYACAAMQQTHGLTRAFVHGHACFYKIVANFKISNVQRLHERAWVECIELL